MIAIQVDCFRHFGQRKSRDTQTRDTNKEQAKPVYIRTVNKEDGRYIYGRAFIVEMVCTEI
jgi:hypothetical protein